MPMLGKAVVLIWNDVTDEGRGAFYEWHNNEHMPERLAIPGFIRGRRLRGDDAHPEWLTIYEADDLPVLTGETYLERLNHPTPATRATVRHFRNTARSICTVSLSTGISTGGWICAARLDIAANAADGFTRYLAETMFATLTGHPSVLAVHLCDADTQASNIETNEAKERAFTVPTRIVLVEAATREAAGFAQRQFLQPAFRAFCGNAPLADIYAMEITRLSAPQSV
jgi:hypothetical protein